MGSFRVSRDSRVSNSPISFIRIISGIISTYLLKKRRRLSLLQPAAAELSPHLFRRLCWRLIPILWVGYVLNIVDRVNLGYAQLQMKDDLHLAPRTFGLASGIFFIAYALMQLPTQQGSG